MLSKLRGQLVENSLIRMKMKMRIVYDIMVNGNKKLLITLVFS